jgi:hypothetical protein
MRDADTFQHVSEGTLKQFLEKLSGVDEAQAIALLRNLIEFAIRMYLVKTSAFNTTRSSQLLDSLGLQALGHTRAD